MKRLPFLLLLVCGMLWAACGSDSAAASNNSDEPLVKKISSIEESPSLVEEEDSYYSDTEDDSSASTYSSDYDDSSESDSYDSSEDTSDSYYDNDSSTDSYEAPYINEEEASLFMGRFKTTYEKLLTFKDNPDFHQMGFVQPGEYHDWMVEAQDLRDNPLSEQLVTRGLMSNELVLLGIEYLASKGQETHSTLMFNEDFKKLLY